MSTMSLRLPDSLHRRLREFAQRDDVSINQLITTAVAEKMAALSTVDYLAARAANGNRKRFEAVLAKVPDVEPTSGDALAIAVHEDAQAYAVSKPSRTPRKTSMRQSGK